MTARLFEQSFWSGGSTSAVSPTPIWFCK